MTDPSPRAALALRLAETIRHSDLDSPYGGDVSKNGRYYGIGFSMPNTLDGEVRVFGSRFIQIRAQGALVSGEFNAVYESEDAALTALTALANCDTEALHAIPTKGAVMKQKDVRLNLNTENLPRNTFGFRLGGRAGNRSGSEG